MRSSTMLQPDPGLCWSRVDYRSSLLHPPLLLELLLPLQHDVQRQLCRRLDRQAREH